MNRIVLLSACVAALLSGGAANAAVMVVGDGLAHVCFELSNQAQPDESALKVCDRALNSDLSKRDRAATLINRGVIELVLDRPEAAQSDFNKGIEMMPDMGEGYLNRGAAFIAQHRFSDALDEINAGLKLGVSRPAIGYYDRAVANEGLGNLRAAYDDYHRSLAVDPGFERATTQLKRFRIIQQPGN